MIIKEFRVVIPMSVEEYQIGQLYTIQKKSRLESVGAGSGVEILENRPYELNDEKGQYTLKMFHVDERLPAGLKTASKLLFPKSALHFEEESWNCYPYTRTHYSHQLFKSFKIDFESRYENDCGQSDNVFNLSRGELEKRLVEYVDIVSDPLPQNVTYNVDEDPQVFRGHMNPSRGPLGSTWLANLRQDYATAVEQNTTKPECMCVYKLCRIQCPVWGCQSRVEKLISDSVIRQMILVSHRQAWCWQDEYYGLTMDDVRNLELETQRYLNLKMRNDPNAELNFSTNFLNMTKHVEKHYLREKHLHQQLGHKKSVSSTDSSRNKKSSVIIEDDDDDEDEDEDEDECLFEDSILYSEKRKIIEEEEDDDKLLMFNDKKIALPPIVNEDLLSQGSNTLDDQFFDAISEDESLDATISNFVDKIETKSRLNSTLYKEKQNKTVEDQLLNVQINSSSSNSSSSSSLNQSSPPQQQQQQQNNNSNNNFNNKSDFETKLFNLSQKTANHKKTPINRLNSSRVINTLILVVHGGNVTCTDTSKKSDFLNFRATMDTVIKQHYTSHTLNTNSISYRLISLDNICKQTLIKLTTLSPEATEQNMFLHNKNNSDTNNNNDELPSPEIYDNDNYDEDYATIFSLHDNLPFNALPLLVQANEAETRDRVNKFTRECNRVYKEFLKSDEGEQFQGQIVLVADSIGSLLVYDALCNTNNNNENNPIQQQQSQTLKKINSLTSKEEKLLSTSLNSVKQTTTPLLPPIISVTGAGILVNDDDDDEELKHHPKSKMTKAFSGSVLNENCDVEFNLRTESMSSEMSSGAQHFHSFSNLNSRNSSSGSDDIINKPSSPTPIAVKETPILEERLEFDVEHFFIFGSPLGLVLTYRKLANKKPLNIPCCKQMYNLFHLTDPIAARIEPLICKQFRYIQPCMIPRYSRFPLGDGSNHSLDYYILKNGSLFDTNLIGGQQKSNNNNNNNNNTAFNFNDPNSSLTVTSHFDRLKPLQRIIQTKNQWWGENRVDYVLYAPETITNLPRKSLPYIFHSCFWESTDVVSFIIRMISNSNNGSNNNDHNIFSSSSLFNVSPQFVYNQMQKEQQLQMMQQQLLGGEKWQRRMNRVKLRNLAANHRANDVIVLEEGDQVLNAKFSYGPFDFVLSGEKIDIFIKKTTKDNNTSSSAASTPTGTGVANSNNNNNNLASHNSSPASSSPQPQSLMLVPNTITTVDTIPLSHINNNNNNNIINKTALYKSLLDDDWQYVDSALTDSNGRCKYELAHNGRCLSLGMYQVKMIVKCDQTKAEFNMAVLPPNTEAVVFSIDGSFAANVSLSGTDPKVRPGSVDVVRHWQDLGYLIIYITARPDMQHYKVTNWLAQHNFPFGMVYFSDGFCRDPIRQKTETLKQICTKCQIKLHAAYGSSKDIGMYARLGVPWQRLFIIGKSKNKDKYVNQAMVLRDGYATHLSMLKSPNNSSKQATGNARLILKKSTFVVKPQQQLPTPLFNLGYKSLLYNNNNNSHFFNDTNHGKTIIGIINNNNTSISSMLPLPAQSMIKSYSGSDFNNMPPTSEENNIKGSIKDNKGFFNKLVNVKPTSSDKENQQKVKK